MHLRGFDGRGAAAALHSASDTGFTVSGVFRAMDDFCVLMLYDADNPFEHYSMKYLPDFDFSGMVLAFDLTYEGLQPIDSRKWNWVDWATLDVVRPDGSSAKINLFDHATLVAGSHTKAETTFTVLSGGQPLSPWLHCTLWYQNLSFDYWGDGGHTPTDLEILTSIASQINAYNWSGVDLPLEAEIVPGPGLRVRAARAGEDGNHAQLYATSNSSQGLADVTHGGKLSGGSSAVTWRVSIDFSALGIDQVRQAWLTFAPKLPTDAKYVDTEWTATFSNWGVTDPCGKRSLKIAGPGSVRVGSRDAWCSYSGAWTEEASNQPGGTGWFYHGFARRASAAGDRVTVKYACQSEHDLYLGTSLYKDRGIVSVRVDGAAVPDLDCFLWVDSPVVTRRLLKAAVAPGEHTVEITLTGNKHTKQADWDYDSLGTYFYFDFLEAAVRADVQDPAAIQSAVMPATDYDTDHGYKLSPERLVWNLERLGFAGAINQYLGVFWWNQRRRVGGTFPKLTLTFSGPFQWGDQVFLTIGSTTMGKYCLPNDTFRSVAEHFLCFINSVFVGIRADWGASTESTAVIDVTCLTPNWSFTYSLDNQGHGLVSASGSLEGGTDGTWEIDAAATPKLNRAASDWHARFYAEVAARSWSAVTSLSMELVNPPDAAPDAVWAARFADGQKVETATGFASLKSTHCAFTDKVLDYQKAAYTEIAAAMSAAGLTPWLQFGEFLWWFFDWYTDANGNRVNAGMAFYDDYTKAQAQAALGRPLYGFAHTTDDPGVNGGADVAFLRGRLKAHIDAIRAAVLAVYPTAKFELLWPLDVNYPTLTSSGLGGRLNRAVNLPTEYEQKSGSGLDRLKMEALAFGSAERHLERAKEAIRFPYTDPLSWPKADVAYLVPIFNGGCPWSREYLYAVNEAVPVVNLWAFDHVCLLSWPVPLPTNPKHLNFS